VRWRKLGLVYVASGEQPWAQSHAFIPTSFLLNEETIRVYVAFVDRDRIGRIGYVDVSARDPKHILSVSPHPVLDIGLGGTFDDNGVTPVCLLAAGNKLYLYYVGWQLGVRVRYYLFVGLARSTDQGKTFSRVSEAPILDRCDGELFVRTACHVMPEENSWRMWYIGGDQWITVGGKEVPTYSLRHMRSESALDWRSRAETCLTPEAPDEYGFGRPFIRKKAVGYEMWYSIRTRSKGYRLGYAESADGVSWTRKDSEVGIDVSPTGWDSEMICFACLQETKYGTYMFYNGNNYGETGFGVAVRES
jgi:hypothetical protein